MMDQDDEARYSAAQYAILDFARDFFRLNLIGPPRSYDEEICGPQNRVVYAAYIFGRETPEMESALHNSCGPEEIAERAKELFKTKRNAGFDVIVWRRMPDSRDLHDGRFSAPALSFRCAFIKVSDILALQPLLKAP